MADYEFLVRAGETYFFSTMAALLSSVVRDQGRDEDALVFSKEPRKRLRRTTSSPRRYGVRSARRSLPAPETSPKRSRSRGRRSSFR